MPPSGSWSHLYPLPALSKGHDGLQWPVGFVLTTGKHSRVWALPHLDPFSQGGAEPCLLGVDNGEWVFYFYMRRNTKSIAYVPEMHLLTVLESGNLRSQVNRSPSSEASPCLHRRPSGVFSSVWITEHSGFNSWWRPSQQRHGQEAWRHIYYLKLFEGRHIPEHAQFKRNIAEHTQLRIIVQAKRKGCAQNNVMEHV